MFDDKKRPTYKSREVTLLDCQPCNLDHDKGEAATSITLAYKDSIQPLVISLADSRSLVVGLLISLYTADDPFAEAILIENFPPDEHGHFQWPKLPDDWPD